MPRSRSELSTTDTELNPIAPPAAHIGIMMPNI